MQAMHAIILNWIFCLGILRRREMGLYLSLEFGPNFNQTQLKIIFLKL